MRMTAAEITRVLTESFPGSMDFSVIEEISDDGLRLRVPYRPDFLRPGGTLAGPVLMSAADTAVYFLILANIGPELLAVTTSLDIHFLRRPAPRDLVCQARLLKLGRRLAVGDVLIYTDGDPAPVAQANVTYSLPVPDAA